MFNNIILEDNRKYNILVFFEYFQTAKSNFHFKNSDCQLN